MYPRVKVGLLVGGIGLLLNICIATAFGLCGPMLALLSGAVAGFLAAQQEKAPTKGEGARIGAISGFVAGGLILLGQMLGAIVALLLVQLSGVETIFGSTAPPPSANAMLQIMYYVTGLGVGVCFGAVGIILSILAGAATGYLGT